MKVPRVRPRRPRRGTVVAGAGLLLGVVGGWTAGLLRVAPHPLPDGSADGPTGVPR